MKLRVLPWAFFLATLFACNGFVGRETVQRKPFESKSGIYGLSQRVPITNLNLPGSYPDGNNVDPPFISQTRIFSDLNSLTTAPGFIEYDVNQPLWSQGASKRRWAGFGETGQIGFTEDGAWVFPIGTVLVKAFEIELANGSRRPLEIRLFIRTASAWEGFTYQFVPASGDYALLTANTTETITGVAGDLFGQPTAVDITWTYPASNCVSCHNQSGGPILGIKTSQMNRGFSYPSMDDNQLRAWNNIGLFARDIENSYSYDSAQLEYTNLNRLAALTDSSRTLEDRVKSYLDVNCSMCHRPGGSCATPNGEATDFRYETDLANSGLIGGNRSRVVQNDPGNSLLWTFLGGGSTFPSNVTMPPAGAAGASLPNPDAVSSGTNGEGVIGDFIRSL